VDEREHACALVIACMALLAACGGSAARSEPSQSSAAPAPPPQRATAQPAPAAAVDPSLPASKRIQGRWLVNLKEVPRYALKQTGVNPKARIEYTITESEFIMEGTAGARVRWHYEIVSESGDELVLRKVDGPGAPEEATVKVSGRRLVISKSDQAPLPLDRID
jgi:hypothetical protein